MSEETKELKRARMAKEKARKIFPRLADVVGVGITRRKGVYHVKVNVAEEPAENAELPENIDGVPVVLHVTGKIRKQRRARS